ncbi:hypothetical protein ACFQ07_26650 [Actinomadura adrarensis]|uniref:DUF3108 domain-containing protein n=1 Tax=Actinomadura adrarensis TaxID=1819600 RepID=A0ABW3CNM5_9ACTN
MFRSTAVAAIALAALFAAPSASAEEKVQDVYVKESAGRIKATGPGFTLKVNRHGITSTMVEDEFGDPATGNEILRQFSDLTGRTYRPFVCENGTYTITAGTFERFYRYSTMERRPAPYTERFHANFAGQVAPFMGEFDATVTDEAGETLRVLISDLGYEAFTEDGGFRATYPIHGFIVDQQGEIRDRISLLGRFRSGPGGANASYWVEDRGTCHQRADLGWNEPNTDNVVVTGPLLVLPFNAPVITPEK